MSKLIKQKKLKNKIDLSKFRFIMGSGRCLISRNGEVFDVLRKRLKKISIDAGGYLVVYVAEKGERKSKKIHRLIAEIYLDNFQNLPQINHLNGIKKDNRPENLEWCTSFDNIKHAWAIGLISSSIQVNHWDSA